MSYRQDHMNTSALLIFQRPGIGEMSTTPTGFHGQEINTSPNTAAAVGLMVPLHQLLTESTSSETELGQT